MLSIEAERKNCGKLPASVLNYPPIEAEWKLAARRAPGSPGMQSPRPIARRGFGFEECRVHIRRDRAIRRDAMAEFAD